MQWYTSNQIPDSGPLINGRELLKQPLEGVAQTQPQYPEAPILTTKVKIVGSNITADNTALSIPVTGQVIEVDAAYDQINRLNCAWIEDGILHLYWYDPVVPGFVTSVFGPASRCFLFMDDTRWYIPATAFNAMLLIYVRDAAIYVREQSDRFQVEELVALLREDEKLLSAGMNSKYRIQLLLERESLDSEPFGTESELHIYAVDDAVMLIDNAYVTYED